MAVTFEDQAVYGNFVGHNVHLVRLEDDTDLEPGRYAWIAEVPEANAKGMLQIFEVP